MVELELYINHYNIAFKEKKDQKLRVAKVHIGSKILTVRTTFNQLLAHIQRLINSDSDRVERIVGSSSNSSDLND